MSGVNGGGWGGPAGGSLAGDIVALSQGKGVPATEGSSEPLHGESGLPPIPGWSDAAPAETEGDEDANAEEQVTSDEDRTDDEDVSESEGKQAAAKNGKTKQGSEQGTKKRIPIDKGRQYLEVDYNDRAAIDRAFVEAHGFRKMQVERDQAKKQAETLRGEHEKLRKDWSGLDEAWSKGGVEGLVDLLEGRQGAFKEYVSKKMEREKFLATADPHEKDLFLSKEREAERIREIERMRKENEDFRTKMEKEREDAELASLRSRVNPAFEKYRFAGTLGDEAAEHTFDSMMWNEALRRLEPYEEQGLDITPELISRTFKDISGTLRRRMANQADRQTKRAVENKKREAAESVQSRVTSGYKKNGSAEEEAMALMDSGNLGALFRGWGKYGKLFK